MKVYKWLIPLIVLLIAVYYFTFEPSNNRNWEVGYQNLSHIEINGDLISINGIRNWTYDSQGATSQTFINETYNVADLEKVWFIVEPFSKFGGIAHTYFVFDFKGKEPLAFSVEARREKGETYSAFLGMFKKFEVYHVWGTEKDVTGRRVIIENDQLYMYPLDLSQEYRSNLFKELALQSQKLETEPQFYNTLTDNCTSLLAKYTNKISAGTIPFHYSYFLPGYAAQYLYKLKYISNEMEFSDRLKKSNITEVVRENYGKENFSEEIRSYLNL